MTTRAFQKVYTKIDNITKATVTLRATGVGNDELATVGGKLAQVVKIMGDNVTLQVFAGTEGLATDSEVVFHGEPPKLKVSDNLAGRFFNAYGEPLEGGEQIEGEAREIGGPTVNPFKRNYTAHFKYPLAMDKMKAAAKDFIGEHDFTSFVASGSQAKSNVRRVEKIKIYRDEHDNEVIFEFTGNGFLYNQIRIMVAFLLEVGSNQRPVSDVKRVLAAKDRTQARMTAPASGLYLVSVDYGK